ncbi:MAG: FixG Ig-like domain-containing protein [Candidatus Woesearchaeota archaeon]
MIKGRMKAMLAVFAVLAALLIATTVSAVEYGTRGDGNFTRNDQEDVLNQGDLPGLDVVWVKVNGDIVENGDEIRLSLERNQEIEVRTEVMALQDIDDVTIEAEIYGDDHYQIEDQSDTFDVENQTLYIKSLDLDLPDIMDMDEYDLRVTVAGRTGAVKTYNYLLTVDAPRHAMSIKDVTLNPENSVKAGRALLSMVRVKNTGEETEDSTKVKVSVPELGISAVDYIDDIESDDSISSEELYMRVPSSAESGVYDVKVEVEYDEGFEEVSTHRQIEVVGTEEEEEEEEDGEDEQPSEEKTTITAGSQTQELTRGEGGAIYPITLSNEGSTSKTYTLSAAGTDTFAEVRVSPSTLVVVEPGESETVYVYLTAKETAQPGSYTFTVDVSSGDSQLEEVTLNANVVEGEAEEAGGWDSVKKGLEIGLIILIVLLVILGLIIAFSKMKGGDEDEDEEGEVTGQTYY